MASMLRLLGRCRPAVGVPDPAPGVRRRDALNIIVLGSAAVPLGANALGNRPQHDAGSDAVVGTIPSAGGNRLTLATSDGDVEVILQDGARMYSGAYGEVSSAGQFLAGDRVAAQGRRAGRGLQATSVGSVYTPLEAHVRSVSKDGSVAETSAGPVELRKGRLPFTPRSMERRLRGGKISPGTTLRGQGWRDPRTGERYLMIHGA